jgi:hypothetical protein
MFFYYYYIFLCVIYILFNCGFNRGFNRGFNCAFTIGRTATASKPFCEKTRFTIIGTLGTLAIILLGTIAVGALAFLVATALRTIVLGDWATRYY